MTRRLARGTRIVVASHNPGKLVEIADLIRPYGLDAVAAASLSIGEPEEIEATFAGNARLKALHCARASGRPALSDDSGLAVDALAGAPGIYSARWAGPAKDFRLAMQKVRDELVTCGGWSGAPPAARFVCALCIAWPDGTAEVFEGIVDGVLVWPPRGALGFGYDPMFLPAGEARTFGEMAPDAKHAISHRARAFHLFVRACLDADQS
jgi:XTP/dITP diphosphohydrolase